MTAWWIAGIAVWVGCGAQKINLAIDFVEFAGSTLRKDTHHARCLSRQENNCMTIFQQLTWRKASVYAAPSHIQKVPFGKIVLRLWRAHT